MQGTVGMVEHVTEVEKSPFVGILYGLPGSGKTRLAAASVSVLGPAVYFALDHRGIESVLPEHRAQLSVIRFREPSWVNVMNEIAIHPWEKDFPAARTLIVDTLTTGAKGMLKEAANKAWFRGKEGDGHVTFGPNDASITQKIPSISDYGGAKWLVENFLEQLFRFHPAMNIVLVCHEDLDIPKKEETHALTVGGPATFGRKLLNELPSAMPVVARCTVTATTDLTGKTTAKYKVITAMQGTYIARIREAQKTGNPMPVVTLDVTGENWWREYVRNFMPWARSTGGEA